MRKRVWMLGQGIKTLEVLSFYAATSFPPTSAYCHPIFRSFSNWRMRFLGLLVFLSAASLGAAATCSGSSQCQCLFADGSHCCLYGMVCIGKIPLKKSQSWSIWRMRWQAMTMTAPDFVLVLAESSRVVKMPQPNAMRAVPFRVHLWLRLRAEHHATTTHEQEQGMSRDQRGSVFFSGALSDPRFAQFVLMITSILRRNFEARAFFAWLSLHPISFYYRSIPRYTSTM